MKIVEKYLSLLYYSLLSDLNSFDHWYMWTVIPAIIWLMILIVKWSFLLFPFALPTYILKAFVNVVIKQIDKKKKD